MKDYKYQLEKYKSRASKFACPSCKMVGAFTRYQDQETKKHINYKVGRCDREDKCGYHYTPKQFFIDSGESYKPIMKVLHKPPKPIDFISDEIMSESFTGDNNFIKYLRTLFEINEIIKAIEKYNIGDTKDSKVIFWQIDRDKKIRTGKAMQYNSKTGKRIKKNDNTAFNWIHKEVKQDFNLKQCLYGLHLFDEDKTTAIVESEKTAIIASIMIPQYTWMATGGLNNINLADDLKGCDVVLFPDLGKAYDKWSEYGRKNRFKVSSFLQNKSTEKDKANGLDLADYLTKQTKITVQ